MELSKAKPFTTLCTMLTADRWQVLIFLELPNQRVMAKLNISDYIVIELMKKDQSTICSVNHGTAIPPLL